MKKFLLLATLVLSLGYATAIVAQFFGLLSFNVFSLPTLVGGGIASGLVALACTDYSRRPRFRVRRTTERPATLAPSAAFNPTTLWTYTTRSS